MSTGVQTTYGGSFIRGAEHQNSGEALEAELMEQLFRSNDATEGLQAFVEKRQAEFVGA